MRLYVVDMIGHSSPVGSPEGNRKESDGVQEKNIIAGRETYTCIDGVLYF